LWQEKEKKKEEEREGAEGKGKDGGKHTSDTSGGKKDNCSYKRREGKKKKGKESNSGSYLAAIFFATDHPNSKERKGEGGRGEGKG